ncbi:transcription factor ORG2-like [Primulina tabacum]|uniref:transcription factor ORG2-like n=1 Tax=Primulina tabacum TaxID=48773 RepID=UPI003F5A7502
MLALSPHISNFGWFWEDPNTMENQENPCIQRTDQIPNSVNADCLHSPSSNTAHPKNDDFSSFYDGFIEKGDTDNAAKKLNHNASERDRRKKINTMYATLRSLLPDEDQPKKLSIPATISRVLKYIPEVQKQVQKLSQKKEQLLSKISRQQDSFFDFSTNEPTKAVHTRSSLSAISAKRSDNGDILCQFSTPKGEKGSFSIALLKLEEEGFLVLNGSCFESYDGRIFNNMLLQGRGSLGTVGDDEQYLIEKLLSFNEKMGEAEKRLVSMPDVNYVSINNELTNIDI